MGNHLGALSPPRCPQHIQGLAVSQHILRALCAMGTALGCWHWSQSGNEAEDGEKHNVHPLLADLQPHQASQEGKTKHRVPPPRAAPCSQPRSPQHLHQVQASGDNKPLSQGRFVLERVFMGWGGNCDDKVLSAALD